MVHSTKHYFQVTLTSTTTGATTLHTPVTAVAVANKNLNSEIEEGSKVKAIYMEMWIIGQTNNQFFTAVLAKLPGGVPNLAQADLVDLFSYDNKKNILYTTQGLAPNDGVGQPIVISKGWFKIPKTKQRFGLNDRLQFALSSRGDGTIDLCGFFTYKEYT